MKRRDGMCINCNKWQQGYTIAKLDQIFGEKKYKILSADEKGLALELIQFSTLDWFKMLKLVKSNGFPEKYYFGGLKD